MRSVINLCIKYGNDLRINFKIPKRHLYVNVRFEDPTFYVDTSIAPICLLDDQYDGMIQAKAIAGVLTSWVFPQYITFEGEPIFSYQYNGKMEKIKERYAVDFFFDRVDYSENNPIIQRAKEKGRYFFYKVERFVADLIRHCRPVNTYDILNELGKDPVGKLMAIESKFNQSFRRLVEYNKSQVRAYYFSRLNSKSKVKEKIPDDVLDAYNELKLLQETIRSLNQKII